MENSSFLLFCVEHLDVHRVSGFDVLRQSLLGRGDVAAELAAAFLPGISKGPGSWPETELIVACS